MSQLKRAFVRNNDRVEQLIEKATLYRKNKPTNPNKLTSSENLPDLELNSLFQEVQNKKQNDFVSNFVADHLSNKNNSILMSNRDRY